jgi:hypothetical protein
MDTRQWTNAARSRSSSRSDGPLTPFTFVILPKASCRPSLPNEAAALAPPNSATGHTIDIAR